MVAIFAARKRLGRLAGWAAALAMLYTSVLVAVAGIEVYAGRVIFEEYLLIAPDIRLGLLADGLSFPTLAIVVLLCTALAFYSIRYVEHRVELLYHTASDSTQTGHYARFFYLFLFFPVGFIGSILSTNLVSLYFFLEVLTIALFFLMAYFGYVERVRVAFISLSWGIHRGVVLLGRIGCGLQPDREFRDLGASSHGGELPGDGHHRLFHHRTVDEASDRTVPRLDAFGACRATPPALPDCWRCMPTWPFISSSGLESCRWQRISRGLVPR